MPSTPTKVRPTARRYASLADAAKTYAVSVNTLRRRIADGSLTGYRMGPKLIRVDLNELDGLMRPTRDA